MTDLELKELQILLLKLKNTKPELTVLITEIDEDEVHRLTHKTEDFYCDLLSQIEICLDDETNDNLR